MFCPNCGQPQDDSNAGFCTKCGAPLKAQPDQSPVNQTPAPPVYAPPPPAPPPAQPPAYAPAQPPAYAPPPGYAQPPVKKKKKHGCLITLLILVLLLGAGVLAVYFFVPGLLRPYNLGVKVSQEAYDSAMEKLSYDKDEAPGRGELEDYEYQYGSPQDLAVSLNSEEITSFLSLNRPPYYAIKNVQFRVNPDGTVEAAATLNVAYVLDVMLGGQYSKKDAERELPMLGLIPANINVYAKFSGRVENNTVDAMDIDKVSVMGITIPDSLYGRPEAESFIVSSIDDNIQKTADKSGGSVDLLEVRDDEVYYEGTIPSSLRRVLVD